MVLNVGQESVKVTEEIGTIAQAWPDRPTFVGRALSGTKTDL